MQPDANRDVWLEILSYFAISLSENFPTDLSHKRQTLFSVALKCMDLAEIALDELWRFMDALNPVSFVFNAEWIPSEGEDDQGYWVSVFLISEHQWPEYLGRDCSYPIDTLDSRVLRAHLYLSRIRHLHIREFPNFQELAL
jgi:hypothetical protein